MTVVLQESEFWYNKTVVQHETYRSFLFTCRFVPGFSSFSKLYKDNDSNRVRLYVSDSQHEYTIDAEILICEEIKTIFITHVEGTEFGIPITTFEEDLNWELTHALEFLFEKQYVIKFFDDQEFKTIKNEYAKHLCLSYGSCLPFHVSILKNIAKHLRPTWFDFSL